MNRSRQGKSFPALAVACLLAACGRPDFAEGWTEDPAAQQEPASRPDSKSGANWKVRPATTASTYLGGRLWTLAPINPKWAFVEFDAVLPEDDYYPEAIGVDADGNPSPSCGQAVLVDLTLDKSLPLDRHVCPDEAIHVPEAERAPTFKGCGEAVTLVSSDPDQALFVLAKTDSFGAYSRSCVAYVAFGAGAVTFDTEPGVRYVLMVERRNLTDSTAIKRIGCCL